MSELGSLCVRFAKARSASSYPISYLKRVTARSARVSEYKAHYVLVSLQVTLYLVIKNSNLDLGFNIQNSNLDLRFTIAEDLSFAGSSVIVRDYMEMDWVSSSQ